MTNEGPRPAPLLLPRWGEWRWPKCALQQGPSFEDAAGQDCRIETSTGVRLVGTLVYMNPAVGTIQFQRHGATAWVTIPFSGLRRLTLTTPVPTGGQPSAEFALSVPAAAQACE